MTAFLDRLAPLAWTQIWQVTLVAAAVAVFTRVFCRTRPHLAYVLWLVVLIKCLTPPFWSSPTGLFSWASRGEAPTAQKTEETASNRKVERATHSAATMEQEATEGTEKTANERSAVASENSVTSFPAEAGTPTASSSGVATLTAAEKESISSHDETRRDAASTIAAPPHPSGLLRANIVAALFIAWLAGFIIYAIGVLWTMRGWRRVFRATTPGQDEGLTALATDLARRLGVRPRVRLRFSSEPLGPVAIGWLRPTILLPKALVSMRSLAEIEPLLAHELIHIRRGDALVGLLQIVTQALWWFHPLVWWANRQITRERERSCDEEVIAGLNCEPGRYARGLLDVLELKHQIRPLAALPGVRPFDITKQRLEHIMHPAPRFHKRPPRRYWLILPAGFLLLAPAAALSRSDEPKALRGAAASKRPAPTDGSAPSGDGKDKATAAGAEDAPANSPAKNRPEPVLQTGHLWQIACVAYSLDGHYILTGSNDGSAIVWAAETGRQLRTISANHGNIEAVEFTTDSKKAIVASVEGVVAVYDLGTGKLIRELIPQDQPLPAGVEANRGPIPSCLAVSHDGKQLLVGYKDSTASLWDLNTGEEVRTLQGRGAINSVAFDPEGKFVATNGWGDDAAVLWELATGEKIRTIQADKSLQSGPNTVPSPTSCVAFTPNGTELLAGVLDNTVISWDVKSGQRMRTFQGNRSPVVALAVNDDGTQLVTRNLSGTIILWDVASRRKLHTLQPATHSVRPRNAGSVTFSPNGALVLGLADDDGAALWDVASGKRIRSFDSSSGIDHFAWAAIDPDDRWLFLGSQNWKILSWDATTGGRGHDFSEASAIRPGSIWSPPAPTIAALSPDGKRLLTGGAKVILWDALTGAKFREFEGKFSAGDAQQDGAMGRSAPRGRGRAPQVRDPSAPDALLSPGVPAPSRPTDVAPVLRLLVAFSPDGKRVIGWNDRTINEWNADSGDLIESFNLVQRVSEGIATAAIHPDGKQLLVALAGEGRPERITDEEVSRPHVIVWRGWPFRSLAFNPDGAEVLAAMYGSPMAFSIKFPNPKGIHSFHDESGGYFVDSPSGRLVRYGAPDPLRSPPVGFSADAKRLFTPAYSDHKGLLWDVPSGKIIRPIHGEQDCLGFAVFTADRKHLLTGGLQPSAVLWNTETGTQEAVLIMWNGGKDWLVSAADGFFDGSPGGREELAFRVDGGLDVVPSKDLEKDFYRPGLFATLLRGETPSRAASGK